MRRHRVKIDDRLAKSWPGGDRHGRPGGPLAVLAVLAVLALSAAPGTVRADGGPSREAQLKAAFLYNFAQFTDWPADAFAKGEPALVIGVLGSADPLQGAMEAAVAGRAVNGRPLVVRHFATLDDVRPCHLLYVDDLPGAELPRVRVQLAGAATLLVGNADSFMDAGGLVRLFAEGNRMRFEINPRAVEQARLRISAKLLKLARLR